MRFACPNCHAILNVDEAARGTKGLCPTCGQKLLIPGEHRTVLAVDAEHKTFPSSAAQEPIIAPHTAPSVAADKWSGLKRFAPTPWLAIILIFGLLPWTEISCEFKDVKLQMTQSGYQALYGGVSSPSKVMEVAQEEAAKKLEMNQEELTDAIEMRKADPLAFFSPFMTVFWAAALALIPLTLTAPSKPRLGVYLSLTGVMMIALLVQFLVGLPIDRAIDEAIHNAVRKNPDQAITMAGAVNSSMTVWFWLTLAATVLLGITELAVNGLLRRRTERTPRSIAALAVVAGFITVAITGGIAQAAVWASNVHDMEARLDELERPKREARVREAAASLQRQAEEQAEAQRKQAEEEKEAQARKQQAERQRRQNEENEKPPRWRPKNSAWKTNG
jgi:DNA-directed RNA polymerase subunit RPC12/RpoP